MSSELASIITNLEVIAIDQDPLMFTGSAPSCSCVVYAVELMFMCVRCAQAFV